MTERARPGGADGMGLMIGVGVLSLVSFVGVIWLWIFSSSRIAVEVDLPKQLQVQVDERVVKVPPISPTPSPSLSPPVLPPGWDEATP